MVSAVIALGFPSPSLAGRIGNQPAPSLSNRPEQITAETDPMFYVAVSRDGKWVAYTSERKKFTDLWLRSADPSVIVPPRRLTADPGRESSPAFSPDGRFIAYTGEGATAIACAGAFDADAGDLAIDFPDGIIAIPLYINATVSTSSAGICQCIATASSTLVAATAGQFTAV
ncbi:hypothetical protein LCGC14_2535470, partial [marine sediment metagenome]